MYERILRELKARLDKEQYSKVEELAAFLAGLNIAENRVLPELAKEGLLKMEPFIKNRVLHLKYNLDLKFHIDGVTLFDPFADYNGAVVNSYTCMDTRLGMCEDYRWDAMVRLSYFCRVCDGVKEARRMLVTRNKLLKELICPHVFSALELLNIGDISDEFTEGSLTMDLVNGRGDAKNASLARVYVNADKLCLTWKNGFGMWLNLPKTYTAEMCVMVLDVLLTLIGVYEHGVFCSVSGAKAKVKFSVACCNMIEVCYHIGEYFECGDDFMLEEA